MKWTEQQQKVIETRNSNILVSAAAGSGKTAVLTERIIQRVTDEKHPMDIDRLLVVTFTKAAAREMKDRIRKRLEVAAEQNPKDSHLTKQKTLIHNAMITTIDSFCTSLIRNHFHEVDIEPDFRIADEDEMKLLRQSVLEKIMKENYDEGKEEFLAFVQTYARGNSDKNILDMIDSLDTMSQSYPWPDEWLDMMQSNYFVKNVDEMLRQPWLKKIYSFYHGLGMDIAKEYEKLIVVANEKDGPAHYLPTLESDLDFLQGIKEAGDYRQLQESFSRVVFGRLSSKKYECDDEKKQTVKDMRTSLKTQFSKMQSKINVSAEEMFFEFEKMRDTVTELIRLTRQFQEELTKEKRKKNIVDFSDIEHLALQILVDKDTKQATPTAMEYMQYYEEIMIDEYQDSNYLQEAILSSIAKKKEAGNMFMVGDVKQSIYRFRMAQPEIFVKKYDDFTAGIGSGICIDLNKNFRSRKEILSFANDIFGDVMDKNLGDVIYDEKAMLYYGADYLSDDKAFMPEVLLVDPKILEDKGISLAKGKNASATQLEAKIVADKIHELMRMQKITDEHTKELRPIQFSDIVLLHRSANSIADEYKSVLEENNIPILVDSAMGYFDSVEVETVLAILQVLDNPMQDIPLVAVLHNVFGFSNDLLAKIKEDYSDVSFAQAFLWYMEETKDCDCIQAYSIIKELRNQTCDTPIHEMLETIFDKTGYYNYVKTLPLGELRCANLDTLVDRAIAYESMSFKGVFQFVNYIHRLKKYEVDLSSNNAGANKNAVRLMSIHKSKGLEFPVVFVCGMGKDMNFMDDSGAMIVHSGYGLALDDIDYKMRTKFVPSYKKSLKELMYMETRSEELRILYVAITRAKEKLILTGIKKDAINYLNSLSKDKPITLLQKSLANNYFDWLLPVLKGHDQYSVKVVSLQEITEQEIKNIGTHEDKKETFYKLIQCMNPKKEEMLRRHTEYVYPYENKRKMKAKYSVSEIKHKAMEQESEAVQIFSEPTEKITIPKFLSAEAERKNQGALRGDAMHRIMECYDFTREDFAETYWEQKEDLLQKGFIDKEQVALILDEKIENFLKTNLAGRMAKAARKNMLYVEKPFVILDTYENAFSGIEDDKEDVNNKTESVLIQGIIDVFFEEDDGIVLLDYKTDNISTEQELINRYKKQLELYKNAIERTMNMKVKEIYIYSFKLEKEIQI